MVLVVALALAAGCTSTSSSRYRRPQMTPEELRSYYDYPQKPIQPEVRDKERNARWQHQFVEFEMQLPPDLDGEAVKRYREQAAAARKKRALSISFEYTVRFDYYRPTGPGPHPLVVISPVLGGRTIIEDSLCRHFASHGFCALLVHRKRPSIRPEEGLAKVEVDLRKSVLRVRQALDWALQQPEVAPERIASFGVSYGAIINTIVAGAEPRIRCHVFALGGGDLPNIIMSSAEPLIRSQAARIAQAQGWSREQLREELERTVKSDPLNSAPLLDPDNVLMVVAQFDAVVGTQYEHLLWRRLGKPRRIVVPLGHTTTALALPFIKAEALAFLQGKFGIQPKDSVWPTDLQFHSSKRY